VIRLRDLGADAFKLSAVLKGVVAQRLVRRLCTCAEPITVEQLPPEARPPAGHPAATPKRAVGCKACGGQGFKGRVSVLEIMPVDETVARLVQEGALPPELVKAARPLGMRTLWESAIERVWSGQTTLEEAVRVIGEQVQEDGTAVDEPAAHPSTVPETVQAVVPTPAPGKPAGKLRVLVADDDAQMRRLIKMILEREGYEVVEGTDGLEALDALDRHPVDLMILDVDMPRLNGLGVLEELRARVRTSNVPVIVLTARTDDTEARVLDLGAQDFLNKPVQPQSLLARVRAVLRRAGVS
jgi:CheY-like chemotaxis protein